MNFQELMQRMVELDQPVSEVSETDVDEACGLPPPSMTSTPGMSSAPGQQDNVNMNVSLSAGGAGGIKDLMNILKGIEEKEDMPSFGDTDADADIVIKKMGRELEDDYANEPDEHYSDVSAVTQTGGDLHSKGIEKPAVAGGGNPMSLESLKDKLQAHYTQIKESQ